MDACLPAGPTKNPRLSISRAGFGMTKIVRCPESGFFFRAKSLKAHRAFDHKFLSSQEKLTKPAVLF
jgi:hypothetical protein